MSRVGNKRVKDAFLISASALISIVKEQHGCIGDGPAERFFLGNTCRVWWKTCIAWVTAELLTLKGSQWSIKIYLSEHKMQPVVNFIFL